MRRKLPLFKPMFFFIAMLGLTLGGFAQNVVYVNDASTTGDVFTTAAGNDASDGLTPATPVATIAAAISKVSGGGRILVDAGDYEVLSSTLPTGTKLVGAGKTLTKLSVKSNSLNLASNTEIWNCTIQRAIPSNPSGAPTISLTVSTGANNVHIENCNFLKNRTAIYVNPGIQNLVIKRNVFNDNRTGIIIPDGGSGVKTQLYIYDNEITNNRSYGILFSANGNVPVEAYISNNTISGNLASGIEISNEQPSNKIYLRNNYFGVSAVLPYSGNTNGGFSVNDHNGAGLNTPNFTNNETISGLSYPYEISGTHLSAIDASSFHSPSLISRTGTTNFITSNSPAFNFHHSIQDAIGSSNANAIINIPNGVYNEDVNVNKTVTLIGQSQDGTLIQGVYDWQKTVNIFNIGAENVKINNLTISRDFGGSATGWQSSGKNQGLAVNSNNATIDKVTVKDQRNGIYINNRQNLTLTNSTVKDSRTGMQIVNNVTGAIIKNNLFTGNFTHGLMFNVDGSLNLTNTNITDNLIADNWYTQLYFHKSNTGANPIVTNAIINCNSFGTGNATINNTAAGEPGYTSQATIQTGGTSTGEGFTFGGNQIESHFSLLSLWRNSTDADAIEQGFQLPKTYVISPVTGTPSAINNNYRVLANALGCANSGDEITLSGTFDWTETEAQADWAKGMDANASTTADNHTILVASGKNNIKLSGTAGAKILGPGDLPTVNLESFISFSAINKGWQISNLDIEGFDLSIYFSSTSSGGADSLKILNNTFTIPADAADATDINQNIGIHLSNGKGIEIKNNTFNIDGSGAGNADRNSTSFALQTTTTGSNLYDGLEVSGNTVNVTGVPDATYPARIFGFWENGHNLGANIKLRNNTFTNSDAGNLPANNRQMAFRVTSRSGATGTVEYSNNEITGFHRGIDWIGDPFGSNGPYSYEANATPVVVKNNKFDKVEYGVSVRKLPSSPNAGSPAIIDQNSFTNIGQKAIVYEGSSGITETSCNWFGTSDLTEIADLVSAPNGGSITYNLRLDNGSSGTGVGFTPNGLCIGTVKNVSKNTFHLTIQAAINAADPGNEIIAGAGVFNEQITINKSITLKGAQAGTDPRPSVSSIRTIGGANETIVQATKAQTILNINAPNVTIDGFQFEQTAPPPPGSPSSHAVNSNTNHINIKFTNNIITNTGGVNAIRLYGADNILVSQNYLNNIDGQGIILRNGNNQDVPAVNQKIINNDLINIKATNDGAIYVYGQKDLEISGNIVESSYLGLAIGTPLTSSYYYLENVKVHNNTIRIEYPNKASQTAMFALGISGIGEGIEVYNNIIEQSGTFPNIHPLVSIGHDSDPVNLVNPSGVKIQNNYLSLAAGSTGKYIRVSQNITEYIEATCNWFGTTNFTEISNFIDDRSATGFKHGVTYLTSGTNTLTSGSGFVPETGKCFTPVYNHTKDKYFATIQSAISSNLTVNGDRIDVSPGTFVENITVTKELDIRGPNYGVSPNTGTRTDEAIIIPAASVDGSDVLKVRASSVKINGFTFNGDNENLTSTLIGTNGADIDAGTAVTIDQPNINHLTVSNNIIKNLGYFGVALFGNQSSEANTPKTGHLIKDNKIVDMGYYKTGAGYHRWGGGIMLYNSHYARIEENVIENVRVGIQTGNFQSAHTGNAQFQIITNNTIKTRATGIFYNLHRHSPLTFTGNTITAVFNADEQATSTRSWNGFLLSSLGNNIGESILENNTIDAAGITNAWTHGTTGYNVWNVNSDSPAKISGGNIENVDTGVFLNNYEGYSSNATDGAHAIVSDISISLNANGTGIKVLDSPSSTSHANVQVTLDKDITLTGGVTGILVENANAKVNTPIGNVNFSGQTENYIKLVANANNIDASSAIFDGLATVTMTPAQVLDVEAKIVDKDDTPALGQVTVKYGVKNQTKETANPGTNFRYATIQAAINAADANDVIVADPGTFAEVITINKPLTLNGAKTGVDPRPVKGSTRNTNGTGETIIEGAGSVQLVNITSSDVVFDGFLLRHTTATGSADQISSPNTAKENITVSNNILLNATDEGIQIRKTNNTLIEKNFVSDSKGDGINVCLNIGGSGHKILDNEVYNSRSDFGSIYMYDVDDVEVKGNYIRGLGQGVGIAASDAYGNGGGCKNILVHHNDITSTFTLHPSAAYAVGISGQLTDGVTIKNNNILNTNTSNNSSTYVKLIDVAHTVKNIVVSDNYLDAKNRKAIRVNSTVVDKVIANCNWYGTTDYASLSSQVEILGSAKLKVYPYLSDGTDTDGAEIGFTPLPNVCTGKVYNKTQNDYFLTIQEAVTEASAGDTLLVSSNTYDEQVTINKALVIAKGTGATLPIVKFTGTVTGKPTLFDISADGVVIDSIGFEVDLTKLKSAVIASGATIDNFTFTNNEIAGKGTPPTTTYSDRNAVSVNHTGNTNYRVATGGVDKIVFSNNTVSGELATGGFFRAALAVDEGAVTAKGNTLQTINHDILVRFNSKNVVEITNNKFNGGGVELAEQNAGSGKITLANNEFNGGGAPNTSVLRVKNNQANVIHEIKGNTFNNYLWAVSLENMKSVVIDSNYFNTEEGNAKAIMVNTKSISSNSSAIVQTTIDANIKRNKFNGVGTGILFANHDSDNAAFGTFTVGGTGNENAFGNGLSHFIVLDGQTGLTSGSTFPVYTNTGQWLTTMACWSSNLNIESNQFDVGSGLRLPANLNAAERDILEAKLTHKNDNACLGKIQYFNPVHNLTQDTYFSTIQAAVNAATAKDVIELSEWTFTEAVSIDKPLTIQGVDSSKVILDGSSIAAGNGFTLSPGVKDITIKKLTIKNYKGSAPLGSGIYGIRNSKLTIDSVILDNNQGRGGVFLSGNGGIDSVIISNSISKNHAVSGSRGIVIWDGLKSNISITNNLVINNNCCGIELQDGTATGVLIKGNTIYALDNGIGIVGLTTGSGNAKANIVDSNFVFVKQRFGIEIKNPNGTGNDSDTEDGAIIIRNNEVEHLGASSLTDDKDLAGIAVMRRGVKATNVDIPTGVIVSNNKVSGFVQSSNSTGFGIVIEGTNHTVTGNTLTGNDVGIQQQSGHLPYTATTDTDGNQGNIVDLYFGRGNSPIMCNNTISDNTFASNGENARNVGGGGTGTIVTEVTPTINTVANVAVCKDGTVAETVFTGNVIAGKTYQWTNSNPAIGLAASGIGNIASFSATNTTSDTLVAIITVVPKTPGGCDGTPITFTIKVNPGLVKPSVSPNEATICEGGTIILQTQCLGNIAQWSDGQTGNSITVNPTSTTNYSVKCIDNLGCESLVSDVTTVNVIPRPAKPTLTASASVICNGTAVTLTSSNCLSGEYVWSHGVTTTTSTVSVIPTTTQSYSVVCKSTTTLNCSSLSSDNVTVTVNNADLTAPTTSGNVTISTGASTTLTASCATGTPAWYNGLGENVASGTSFTTPALTVNTDYSVRCVTDVNNSDDCKSPEVIQKITIDKFALVNQPQHIYVCLGQNAFFVVGATGRSISYQWQVSTNGSSWNNLVNDAHYNGVSTSSLSIAAPPASMNDYQFRCIITNTAPDATEAPITSSVAFLAVHESALAHNLEMVSPLTGTNNIYQAVQTIKANNKISGSSNVKYFAGNSVTLEPGFEVSPGSVFTAKVQIPCINTSGFQEALPEKLKK